MAGLNTGGFSLSALPTPIDVPSNIGKFDPTQTMAATNQAMDLAERWRKLRASQQLSNAAYDRAIAEHESALQALPAETKARISLAEGTTAQTPIKTQMLGTQAGILSGTAPSTVAATNAQNTASIGQSAVNLEQARTAFLQETDPRARQLKLANYRLSLGIAHKNGQITDAAYNQMLSDSGIQPDTADQTAQAPSFVAAPQADPSTMATGMPLATVPAPASAAQQSPGRINLSGVQPNIVGGGGLFTSTTNPVTGQIVNRFLTPEGMQFKTGNADSNALAYQQKTEQNLLAAGLDPNQYKDRSGMIMNPAAALKDAYEKTSQPQIPSNYLGSEVRNPVAGLEPVKAAEKMSEIRQKDSQAIATEVLPAIENGNIIKSNMDRMEQLLREHPAMTGYFQNSKLVNGAMQLSSEALSKLKGDPNLAAAMQEFEALHNQSITAIMRYRPEGSTGGQSGGQGTSQSGIGRVLQTEVPWFASASPDMLSESMTNINKAERIKAAVNAIQGHAQYLADIHNELGFIPSEATKQWSDYRKANPAFDNNGSPAIISETPEQYFARVKANPDSKGKPFLNPNSPVQPASPEEQKQMASSVSPAAHQNAPTIKTQADYDALRAKGPGIPFLTPSGKLRYTQ